MTGTGDEFDRLADSLNAMLERIEHLLHGLKDVSDNIAHDLKTPLTRLRNRVEAALAGPPSSEAYRAALEATIEESDRLIQTFNALLMIARIEAGSPDGAMTEVEAGADRPRRRRALRAGRRGEGHRPRRSTPASRSRLKASRELLGQALANLIDNAIKYGSAGAAGGTTPIVDVVGARRRTISCSGSPTTASAIPEADRERVPQRFVRLEKSRSQPGSGLGLSLVAAVAQLHHGTIELGDGNPGLVVTMRLPLDGIVPR